MLNTDSKSHATKVVFIGNSTPLRTLRTWARGSGLTVTEQPVSGVLCVVADEVVLDGRCTREQGERLAVSRELGLECLSPALARHRLIGAFGLMSDRSEHQPGSGSIYPC